MYTQGEITNFAPLEINSISYSTYNTETVWTETTEQSQRKSKELTSQFGFLESPSRTFLLSILQVLDIGLPATATYETLLKYRCVLALEV